MKQAIFSYWVYLRRGTQNLQALITMATFAMVFYNTFGSVLVELNLNQNLVLIAGLIFFNLITIFGRADYRKGGYRKETMIAAKNSIGIQLIYLSLIANAYGHTKIGADIIIAFFQGHKRLNSISFEETVAIMELFYQNDDLLEEYLHTIDDLFNIIDNQDNNEA